jgi:SAM-dependent methyltransferase
MRASSCVLEMSGPHVEQATAEALASGLVIDAAVGDARHLDLPDASADAVLLLGPLYHLVDRSDRAQCLAEACRVLRPGGILFAAAISRWAARLQAEVVHALDREVDGMRALVSVVEATGVMPPLSEGSFSAYCHRPDELRDEVESAGLECVDLVSVEGIAFALADLDERLASGTDRDVVLDAARALERVPELLGLSPHLIATARRPVLGA